MEWAKKNKAIAFGLLALLSFWLLVGFIPIMFHDDEAKAGEFGDSFGFVNSLFSGFAFLIATYALIKQIEESHESGKIQEQQIQIQTKQMQLAEEAARLQDDVRKDYKRRIALEALLKVKVDVQCFTTAYLIMRHYAKLPHGQQPATPIPSITERYYDSLAQIKSNVLSIDLIFGDAGKALSESITKFYSVCEHWLATEDPLPQVVIHRGISESVSQIEHQTRELWKSKDAVWQ